MENAVLIKKWDGQQEGETSKISNIRDDILKYNLAIMVSFGVGEWRGEPINASSYKEQVQGRRVNYKINISTFLITFHWK